jgi:hypothetical protein
MTTTTTELEAENEVLIQKGAAERRGGYMMVQEADVPERQSVAPETDTEKIVVICFHGMGTHLPLDALKGGLVELRRALGVAEIPFKPYSFSWEGQLVTEVRFQHGHQKFVVTEAYYSPYFKGKTNVADVLSFLGGNGLNALMNRKPLTRTIFGKVQAYQANPGTGRTLFFILLMILSLIWMNGVFVDILLKFREGTFQPTAFHQASGLAFSVTLGLALCFGLGMLIAKKSAATLLYLLFLLLCASIPLGALYVGVQQLLVSMSGAVFVPNWPAWGLVALGVTFAAGSWLARSFFDGYVGDVVAYVSGYSSSKFFQSRIEINARVDKVFKAVTQDGCDKLIVLAHSLGTVVAYDALNRFLLRRELRRKVGKVEFITFGSPLDKIAYIWRSESGGADILKTQLVADRQPLISREEVRAMVRWQNVYAKYDIVAGSLEYYDSQEKPQYNVINIEDVENKAPIASHNEYVNHDGLVQAIRTALGP